jgi:hypothetical protein
VFYLAVTGNLFEIDGGHNEQITGVAGAPPPVRSGLTSFVNTQFARHQLEVFYLTWGGNGEHVIRLIDGFLGAQDLNIAAGGVPVPAAPGSELVSLTNLCTNTEDIFYIGADQLIHLFRNAGRGWISDPNISNESVLVEGTSLVGHLMMSGSEEVFYVGTDNHVHEIWGWLSCKNGPQFDGWHPTDLNLANGNGAPATEPFSPLASFEDTLTGDDQVFYVDNIHHIHEFLFTKPAIWQQFDVTHISGSNPVRPRSTLAGHEESFTPSEEVSFEGGRWVYLYRAVDKAGQTVDFFLSRNRDGNAAKTFLRNAMKNRRTPSKITLDAYAASHRAVREMKETGELPGRVRVRSSQ